MRALYSKTAIMQLPLLALPTASGTREPDPDHLRRLDANDMVIDNAARAERNDPAMQPDDPRVSAMVDEMERLLLEGRTPRLQRHWTAWKDALRAAIDAAYASGLSPITIAGQAVVVMGRARRAQPRRYRVFSEVVARWFADQLRMPVA